MRDRAFVVLASFVLAASPLAAQDTPLPRGGGFFVNFPATGQQIFPDVAADGADNFQVVWQVPTGDPLHQDVRFRRIEADLSNPAEQPLAQTTAGDQREPRVAMEADGDWYAVWTSEDEEEEEKQPIGRFTTSSGSVLEDEVPFTTDFGSRVVGPDVAFVGADHVVAVWRESAGTVGANFRSRAGTDFGPSEVATGAPAAVPAVAGLGGDAWVVAWHAPDADSNGAYLRCFAAADASAVAFLAHGLTTGDQTHPDVATLGVNRFVAVWRSDGAIVGRIFARAESGLCGGEGPEFAVSTPGQPASKPRVAAGPDGAFVVAWSESTLDPDGGIAAREFRHDATPIGAPFAVLEPNVPFPGVQDGAAVAVSASTFIVVWNHANDVEPVERDIGARVFFRRLVFADGFETADIARWSDSTVPL